jgi:hypothetical protein
MINQAFIFAVDTYGNFHHSFEMEVMLTRDTPEANEFRQSIQALYEKMTGYKCEVHWDYEHQGE